MSLCSWDSFFDQFHHVASRNTILHIGQTAVLQERSKFFSSQFELGNSQYYSYSFLLRRIGHTPETFSWSVYVKETRSQAAPKHLFQNYENVRILIIITHWCQCVTLTNAQHCCCLLKLSVADYYWHDKVVVSYMLLTNQIARKKSKGRGGFQSYNFIGQTILLVWIFSIALLQGTILQLCNCCYTSSRV